MPGLRTTMKRMSCFAVRVVGLIRFECLLLNDPLNRVEVTYNNILDFCRIG